MLQTSAMLMKQVDIINEARRESVVDALDGLLEARLFSGHFLDIHVVEEKRKAEKIRQKEGEKLVADLKASNSKLAAELGDAKASLNRI